MKSNRNVWNRLFLFCAGLFIGTTFCMKWMEVDFRQDGALFTIIGIEATYTKEKLTTLFSGLDERVRTILQYHLYFDFAFMAGVYPGILCLCMMARKRRVTQWVQRLLLVVGLLQFVAWGCDVVENLFLLQWIAKPGKVSSFGLYHTVVFAKWILVLLGVFASLAVLIAGKRSPTPDEP
jgi:hypothetical protein